MPLSQGAVIPILVDDFNDNSLNASKWAVKGNSSDCAEANNRMECTGNDKWIKTLNLQTVFGFNPLNDWNLSFKIIDKQGVVYHPSLSIHNIVYPYEPFTAYANNFAHRTTNPTNMQIFNGSSQNVTSVNEGAHNTTIKKNATAIYLYINDVLRHTALIGQSDKNFSYIAFGDIDGNTGTTLLVDDFRLIQITDDVIPDALTLNTNLINHSNISSATSLVTVNASFTENAINYLYTCNLNISNVINATMLDANLSHSQVFNISWGQQEASYNLSVSCYNLPLNATTGKYLYQVDTIIPSLDFGTFGNNSIVTRGLDILNFSVDFNDTNLYAANLSIIKLNPDGSKNSTMNSSFATNIIGTGKSLNFSFDRSINPALAAYQNYKNGRYEVQAIVWDSHTALEIGEYDKRRLDDGLSFDTDIKITSPDLVFADATKTIDRYNFDMEFKKSNPTIYIDCPQIEYLPHSEYKGHFICWQNKKWIDFEDYNGNVQKIDVKKINNSRYEIVINPKNWLETLFNFNSIGDLNSYNESMYFNISDGFTFYAEDVITTLPIQEFTVTVNSTPQQVRSTTGGNITFNITEGTYMVNISSPDYVDNSTVRAFTENSSMTWVLTAANSLYLLIFDELTNQYITQNVTLKIINFDNVSYEVTTETGVYFQQGFSSGSYQIIYSSENYALRQYFTEITGGDTQTLRLYLLNSTPSTHLYKNIQVADESNVPIGSGTYDSNGNTITNATIELRRFYIDCNCYRVVEMARTGENGKTFVFAQLYDGVYKIYVNILGNYLKITPELRFDTRDIFVTVNLLQSVIDDYLTGTGVFSSIDYSSDTGFVGYTWLGGAGIQSGTIEIIRLTAYNEYPLHNQTIASSGDTLAFNLSPYINSTGTIVVRGYVTTSLNNTYQVALKTIDWGQSQSIFGLTGVFMTMLIVMVLALVGYTNPVTAIILGIVGLVGSRMIGLIYLDLGWLLGLVLVALIYAFKMRT
jgi:hypothetical protein